MWFALLSSSPASQFIQNCMYFLMGAEQMASPYHANADWSATQSFIRLLFIFRIKRLSTLIDGPLLENLVHAGYPGIDRPVTVTYASTRPDLQLLKSTALVVYTGEGIVNKTANSKCKYVDYPNCQVTGT